MISKLGVGVTAVGIGLGGAAWSQGARAQPMDNAGQAETAFKEAMQLRSAGHDAEACPKFALSKRLDPGVGVTLYLADCYQRTGRPASAWQEFRDGERLARERGDKRAGVAAERAAALEPKLNRLTLEIPAGDVKAGLVVQFDGRSLSPDSLNVALAVDPGDHVVTVASPGQVLLTLGAHVDASNPHTVVHLGGPAAPAPTAISGVPSATEESPSEHKGASSSAARWVAGGLMVAGAAGIGIGTWLVTTKTQDMMANGQLCDPHLRPGAVPEAAAAFSAGGVAVLSGILLYYVNRPGRNEVSFSPTFVTGGGGATLRGRF